MPPMRAGLMHEHDNDPSAVAPVGMPLHAEQETPLHSRLMTPIADVPVSAKLHGPDDKALQVVGIDGEDMACLRCGAEVQKKKKKKKKKKRREEKPGRSCQCGEGSLRKGF